MGTLKDLLPILGAGVAGAASPQGADVFNNILRQKRVGEQQDRQERESDQRLTLAQMASDRAERGDARAEKNQEGVTSLREMRMGREQRAADDYDRERAGEAVRVKYLMGEHPELVAAGVLTPGMSQDDAEDYIKSEDDKNPTWEESIDNAKYLRSMGLSGSFETDKGRIGTGSTATKTEKVEPPFDGNMAQEIYLDAQPAIQKAEENYRQSALAYEMATNGMSIEETTPAEIESLRQKMVADQGAIGQAKARVDLNWSKAGASAEQIHELNNPPGQVEPGQTVTGHSPKDLARAKFIANNPGMENATFLSDLRP